MTTCFSAPRLCLTSDSTENCWMVVNMAASLRQRLANRSKRLKTWASLNSKRGAAGPEAGLSRVLLPCS